jgi:ribosomal protein L32
MAPTPKRKQSHKRSARRRLAKRLSLPSLVIDKDTGKKRLPHLPVKDSI